MILSVFTQVLQELENYNLDDSPATTPTGQIQNGGGDHVENELYDDEDDDD